MNIVGKAAIAAAALAISGTASAGTVIQQNFDTPGTGAYSAVGGGIFGAGTGDTASFPTGNVLYMNGDAGLRSVQFSPVNLSAGGTISFDFVLGDYGTPLTYFEGQDGDLEDVRFQYSTDNGATFTDFDRYSTAWGGSTGTRNIAGWTSLNYSLGANPLYASTTLRFLQAESSGNCCDHWAIDNLTVNASTVSAVPEPAAWALMIGGFGVVGGAMRRRRPASTLAMA